MTMTAKRCKGTCGRMLTGAREMCLSCSGDIPGGRENLTQRVAPEPQKITPEKMDRAATGAAILASLDSLTRAVESLTVRIATVETNARETRASVGPILPTLRAILDKIGPMLESAGGQGAPVAPLPGADGTPQDIARVGGGLDGTTPDAPYMLESGGRISRLEMD